MLGGIQMVTIIITAIILGVGVIKIRKKQKKGKEITKLATAYLTVVPVFFALQLIIFPINKMTFKQDGLSERYNIEVIDSVDYTIEDGEYAVNGLPISMNGVRDIEGNKEKQGTIEETRYTLKEGNTKYLYEEEFEKFNVYK